MKIVKLLSDYMLVEEEPARTQTTTGILLPNPKAEPVRIAKVLMAGPGRRYTDKFVPMPNDIIGQRVIFMIGASDTKQGQQVNKLLPNAQRLIRLGDVLAIVEGYVEVSK